MTDASRTPDPQPSTAQATGSAFLFGAALVAIGMANLSAGYDWSRVAEPFLVVKEASWRYAAVLVGFVALALLFRHRWPRASQNVLALGVMFAMAPLFVLLKGLPHDVGWFGPLIAVGLMIAWPSAGVLIASFVLRSRAAQRMTALPAPRASALYSRERSPRRSTQAA